MFPLGNSRFGAWLSCSKVSFFCFLNPCFVVGQDEGSPLVELPYQPNPIYMRLLFSQHLLETKGLGGCDGPPVMSLDACVSPERS